MTLTIPIPQYKGSSARPARSLSLSKRPKRPARAHKEAAPIIWSGPYADGITDQSHLLPLTVMASHVNLPATDHSEMAPDKDRFPSCFLALRAKTLSEAKFKLDRNYHFEINILLESWERLVKSTSSALSQKMEHLPLVGQTLLNYQLWRAPKTSKIKLHHKDKHFFRNCKPAHPLRSLSLPKRPISSLNLLKPARSLSLPKRPALPNNNIDAASVLRTGFVQQ